MKKLLLTTLLTGSLLLTACQADVMKSADAKKNLEGQSYTVEVYGFEEAKSRIQNLNYEGANFTDAIYAEKGKDDAADLFIAFFFKNIEDAEAFVEGHDSENLAKMNTYVDTHLGKDLEKRVGMHNNVAYLGSQTSFVAAFPDAL